MPASMTPRGSPSRKSGPMSRRPAPWFFSATIAYYKSLGVTVTGDKRKPPEGGDPNSIRTNQARRKERLFFLRYATKPMLAKPSTIIAQVEGSGTAEIVKVWVPELSG